MRKIYQTLIILAAIFTAMNAKSQDDNSTILNFADSDTLFSYNTGKKWSVTWDAYFSYSFLSWGEDQFGFNPPSGAYDLSWSSRWDLGTYIKFVNKSPFTLSIGLGYESDVLRFSNKQAFFDEHNGLLSHVGSDKTKLVARYITLPVIARVCLNRDFSIGVGVIGGLNFKTSHTGVKIKYDNDLGNMVEESTGTSYGNINTWKADLLFSIGIRGFSLTFRQALTPVFKDNTEKELYPFSVGLSLGL